MERLLEHGAGVNVSTPFSMLEQKNNEILELLLKYCAKNANDDELIVNES